jgi:hypothetical protein
MFEAISFGANPLLGVFIISPKFRLKTPCGLDDPSIGSLRLFLVFPECADLHLVDRLRGSRGPSARSPRTVREVPDSPAVLRVRVSS